MKQENRIATRHTYHRHFGARLSVTPHSAGLGNAARYNQLRYVYFPTTCIISLLHVMEDGASAEIAVVGNEAILGISLPACPRLAHGGRSRPKAPVR